MQECNSAQQAKQRSISTRQALQKHMEFDAEKATDVDYRCKSLSHGNSGTHSNAQLCSAPQRNDMKAAC